MSGYIPDVNAGLLQVKHLTKEEQEVINSVLQRNKQLLLEERIRLGKLRQKINAARYQQANTDTKYKCSSCMSALGWIRNRGTQCSSCKYICCSNCFNEQLKSPKSLICKICQDQRLLDFQMKQCRMQQESLLELESTEAERKQAITKKTLTSVKVSSEVVKSNTISLKNDGECSTTVEKLKTETSPQEIQNSYISKSFSAVRKMIPSFGLDRNKSKSTQDIANENHEHNNDISEAVASKSTNNSSSGDFKTIKQNNSDENQESDRRIAEFVTSKSTNSSSAEQFENKTSVSQLKTEAGEQEIENNLILKGLSAVKKIISSFGTDQDSSESIKDMNNELDKNTTKLGTFENTIDSSSEHINNVNEVKESTNNFISTSADQERKLEESSLIQKIPPTITNINNNNDADITNKITATESIVTPSVMLGVHYSSGALWVKLGEARNLPNLGGKIYAKTYLLPDTNCTKQKSAVVDGTSDPQFKATMTYFLEKDEIPFLILNVSIWKINEIGRNMLLGVTNLPLVNMDLRRGSDNWYSLENDPSLRLTYKLVPKLPPIIKVRLMFDPDKDCQNMDGKGSLKICVVKACNVSSLKEVTNLSRVRAYCSLLPPTQWYPTRKWTPHYEIGGNPIWNHTFTYTQLKLQYLLEEVAADISVFDTNGCIGHIRLGAYPSRAGTKHEPYMDSTDLESNHWEEMIGNPGKWIERWHQIDECLEDRKVDLSKKPPRFVKPTFRKASHLEESQPSGNELSQKFYERIRKQILCQPTNSPCSGNERSKSFSTGSSESTKSMTVGKVLAGVHYDKGQLEIYLNRVSGLCRGLKRKKSFNPYLKVYLQQKDKKSITQKTATRYNTKNPFFSEIFTFQIDEEEDLNITTLNISVWSHNILKIGQLLGGVNIPLSSINYKNNIEHWYTLVQSQEEHK